jgi:hypothetical protein
MNELRKVGKLIAYEADNLVPALVRDDNLPGIMTRKAAADAINSIVRQDPALKSTRVWAGVSGIAGLLCGALAAALMMPEAKEFIGPMAPVIAAALASLASGVAGAGALVSKHADQRQTR